MNASRSTTGTGRAETHNDTARPGTMNPATPKAVGTDGSNGQQPAKATPLKEHEGATEDQVTDRSAPSEGYEDEPRQG